MLSRWRLCVALLLCTAAALTSKTELSKQKSEDSISILHSGDILKGFKLSSRIDLLGVHKFKSRSYRQSIAQPVEHDPAASFDIQPISRISSAVDNSNEGCVRINSYCVGKKFFVGGHGEVWRASRYAADGTGSADVSFVLKRMLVKDKPNIFRCALREIYFGDLLKEELRVARYETFFIVGDEYWLVFRDEGVSLHQLLYSMKITETSATLEPSQVWYKLRSSRSGNKLLKGLMHEIISSVSTLHDRGILHRDIKPSNIVLNADFDGSVKVVLIDFSSAVDAGSLTSGLYGSVGPTTAEASEQYLPPESLFGRDGPAYSVKNPMAYDVWTIGIVWLEIILGTSDVFTVDQRTLAMLNHRMRKLDQHDLSSTLLLASMADYCIYRPESEPRDTPGHSHNNNGKYSDVFGKNSKIGDILKLFSRRVKPVRCSVDQMAQAIQSRDTLGIGFHDPWGLDLLYRMLSFDPADRISLRDVLEHAYFRGPYTSRVDGTLHGTTQEAVLYDCALDMKSAKNCLQKKAPSGGIDSVLKSTRPQSSDLDLVLGSLLEKRSDIYSESGDGLVVVAPSDEEIIVEGVVDIALDHAMDYIDTTKELPMYIDTPEWKRTVPTNEFVESISVLSTDIRSLIALTDLDFCPTDDAEDQTCPVYYDREGSDKNKVLPGSFAVNYLPVSTMAPSAGHDGLALKEDVVLNNLTFKCPTCGRSFKGSYDSCLSHITHRKHGNRCRYDLDASKLPECISEHSMLPIDPSSGWCDLQGRRMKMEDTHAVVFSDDFPYKYFGVFDGHFGHRASQFASEHLQSYFDDALRHHAFATDMFKPGTPIVPTGLNLEKSTSSLWRKEFIAQDPYVSLKAQDESRRIERDYYIGEVASAMSEAFKSLHAHFLDYSASIGDNSGTTATVTVLFPEHILVSHVGDSRAVLCCGEEGSAIPLTLDHTADVPSEKRRIELAGGFVGKDKQGKINRVNGKLAVTRSFGDRQFQDGILSHQPDTIILNRPKTDRRKYNPAENAESSYHEFTSCRRNNRLSTSESMHVVPAYDFLILASDGLWDVVSNQEAVDIVCEYLYSQMLSYLTLYVLEEEEVPLVESLYPALTSQYLPADAVHDAARELALEAFVRGSSDNIGVCIIEID